MFDIYNYRQFMKLLTPKIQVVLTGVKSIYLNPYHYTYVIQKQDNHIYLYDEMTMQIIGRTKVPFNQSFKTFTFTDNFNIFCTYIEGRSNPPQQSQVIVFTLQPDGVISYARYMLTRNKSPQNLVLFHICFYEKDSKEKERFIIGLGRSKIYYINLNGEVVKEIQIRYEYRELNLINGFSIKQNKWIFIEDSRLYFATITDKYVINDSLPLENKIASIFLDASIRGQFMAFITQLHTIIILSRKDQKWSIRHKFKVPNLNIRKLCFFYPGINTSTTNKFKDRVYLIIYGAAPNLTEQRNKMFQMYQSQLSKHDNVDRYPVPKEFSEGEHLFIHEYSIEELMGNNGSKSKNIVPKGQFCIKNIGVIKYTIWSNQHNENCVLLFNQNKMIISVDLISILQDAYAGKEWVCLSYRFQAKTANVLFEETEDNFEIEKKQTRTISMAQVNDWSYCLFPKESFIKKSIKRLNCIQF